MIILSVHPEQLLISSILRSKDFPAVLGTGIGDDYFHSFQTEWQWLVRYYSKYQKSPTVRAFKYAHPDFDIEPVNDSAHFADEVIRTHARYQLTTVLRDVADSIADGDIDGAVSKMHNKIVVIAASVGRQSNEQNIVVDFDNTFDDIAARVDRVATNGSSGIPTGFKTFDRATGGLQPSHSGIVAARLGEGKALRHGTRVMTPLGWVAIEDIVVGDYVTGSNGKPTEVIAVTPQGQKQVHRMTFSDNSTIDVCEDHLWTTRIGIKPWKVQTTAQVMKWISNGQQHPAIPQLSSPVTFDRATDNGRPAFSPYQLGLLLGDGCFTTDDYIRFTTADSELADSMRKTGIKKTPNSKYEYVLPELKPVIQSLGLLGLYSHQKFVPDIYKIAEAKHRLSILQGLLDSDGGVTGSGGIEFSSTSLQLAQDVQFLAESLGGYAHWHERQIHTVKGMVRTPGRKSYRLIVVLPTGMEPFRLKRKATLYQERTKYQPTRTIRSVKPLGVWDEMTCITVAAPDSLFVTEHCLVTHNSWALVRMATSSLVAGYTVQYHALEQSRTEIAMRVHTFLSSSAGKETFNNIALSQGKGFDLGKYKEFLHRLKKEITGKFFVADASGGQVSPVQIAAQIERNRPDVVFIDYMTLMKVTGDGDWKSISRLSGEIKSIATQYQIPIVSAAQLNRENGLGREPAGPEALAQSDSIGQDADWVVTMKKQSASVVKMMLAKNRHGESGKKWFTQFQPTQGIFRECSYDAAMALVEKDRDAEDSE